MNIRGVIFDLDGVLTNTSEYHYRAWQRLADEEGIPFTRRDNEALRGVSRRESLALLLKGQPVTEEQAQILMERKNRYYQEMIQQLTSADLLEGAAQLLDELRALGIKIAIASVSKNTWDVLHRLCIAERIDAVSDGYSVVRQKPAPDLFVHAAGQLHLPVNQCVVIEDAAAGVEAAQAAGMQVVGLGPKERVGAADVIFPSLAGVHWQDILAGLEHKPEGGLQSAVED